ncbi:MAG: thiamine phosphate synthase [Campylobacterales bacterium]|nr:thiamine phosphate synthase [Campylobacterales bacterium]
MLEFASGLHMGQEDLEDYSIKFRLSKQETIEHIKGKYPNKIIGLSTHNKIEIVEANSFDLDYIGLGAYRVTTTKDVKNSLGDTIIDLAKCSKHPVGAIGGVKLDDEIPYVSYLVIGSDLLKNG